MKENMGNADKVIRALLAGVLILLAWGGFITGIWAIVLMIIGGIFIVTALIGTCPLYSLFGLSTCPVDSSKSL